MESVDGVENIELAESSMSSSSNLSLYSNHKKTLTAKPAVKPATHLSGSPLGNAMLVTYGPIKKVRRE